METPETEQPPSLTQPEASEEHVEIIIDSKDPDVPKIQVTEDQSKSVANGGLQTPRSSPAVSPAPTPAPSSAPTPVPSPRSGQNGSLTKGTPERTSTGGNAQTVSPYINGGIINKRYSYSGSMASESMDMSIHKENISMSVRVSQPQTWVPSNVSCMNVLSTIMKIDLYSGLSVQRRGMNPGYRPIISAQTLEWMKDSSLSYRGSSLPW